jgi:ribonucleoside-triphosphate reductase (thioredoxin)
MPMLDIKPEHRVRLSDKFLANFKDKQPEWGPLGLVTYKRTYARKVDGRTEEWWQTVQRVVEGTYTVQKWHCNRLNVPWSDRKAQHSAQEMYTLIFDMKFLPPGRGLWMMGTDYIEKHGGAALNNCAFVSTEKIEEDLAEPFIFLMEMSMLGVGVGGDTKGAGKIVPRVPVKSGTYQIPDSREGWVEAVRRVLAAHDPNSEETLPEFDFSLVRPAGEPIKGFGGTSAGPDPLRACLRQIREILSGLAALEVAIRSSTIVDIFNIIGKCVVSGNVRRSAEVLLGEASDQSFIELKDPDKYQKELDDWRWASNNSIFAKVGMSYEGLADRTAKNGEPGYLWMDTVRGYGRLKDPRNNKDRRAAGSNPCLEQTLESYELCCLVETFPSRHETYEEYERTLKFAYLYAKTVTLIPTHNKKTNRVMMRNRRIGCSQSGIVESFKRHGRRTHLDWCDRGYNYIQELDEQYSEWLAIPRSIKTTSVKPSGTVSLLPGVTPGIHYEHSEYYYRTMRIANQSTLLKPLLEAGYRVEPAITEPNTQVVYFPVKAKHFDKGKSDVTMWEQLENAAAMQYYWADNQVSITVTFKPEEARDIQSALELYETRLKSVSFLPELDHGYKQAPYIAIGKAEYDTAAARLSQLALLDDTHEVVDAFCDSDKCTLPNEKG